MLLSDSEVISLCDQYMHGSDHPDQVGYREQVKGREFADKALFLERQKMLADLGEFHNKRLLDVGCGFGWHAFVFSLLGNNSVVGLDILPGMIEGMNESIETMKTKGVVFSLAGICGDICNVDLEPNSFDAIYSNEAIEHVHDMDLMMDRCRHLLTPGGKLLLINDQNIYDRKGAADTLEMYEKREHSWEWCAYLKSLRPIEHGNAKPFAVMRTEIVTAANPALTKDQIERIVYATPGMLRADIEKLAVSYKDGMPLPNRPRIDWCRNPDTGEYAERLFDPFALAAMLRKRNFKRVQVRHYFRRLPLNFFNGIQFPPLNKALFNVRPQFIIYGERSA
jgi:SAM-dependent methyltransferase